MRVRTAFLLVGLLGCRASVSIGPADDPGVTPPATPPAEPPPAPPGPPPPPAQTFTVTSATIEWLDADDTYAYYLTTTKDLYRVLIDKQQTPEKIGSSGNGLQMGMSGPAILGLAGSALVAFDKTAVGAAQGKTLSSAAGPNANVGGFGAYAIEATPGSGIRVVDQTSGTVSTFDGGTQEGGVQIFATADAAYVVTIAPASKVFTSTLPPPASGTVLPSQALTWNPARCALAGTKLLCASGGSLVTVPLASPADAPTTVTAGANLPAYPGTGPRALAADATSVYWYETTADALVTCTIAACTTKQSIDAKLGDGVLVSASSSKAVVYFDSVKNEIRAVAK